MMLIEAVVIYPRNVGDWAITSPFSGYVTDVGFTFPKSTEVVPALPTPIYTRLLSVDNRSNSLTLTQKIRSEATRNATQSTSGIGGFAQLKDCTVTMVNTGIDWEDLFGCPMKIVLASATEVSEQFVGVVYDVVPDEDTIQIICRGNFSFRNAVLGTDGTVVVGGSSGRYVKLEQKNGEAQGNLVVPATYKGSIDSLWVKDSEREKYYPVVTPFIESRDEIIFTTSGVDQVHEYTTLGVPNSFDLVSLIIEDYAVVRVYGASNSRAYMRVLVSAGVYCWYEKILEGEDDFGFYIEYKCSQTSANPALLEAIVSGAYTVTSHAVPSGVPFSMSTPTQMYVTVQIQALEVPLDVNSASYLSQINLRGENTQPFPTTGEFNTVTWTPALSVKIWTDPDGETFKELPVLRSFNKATVNADNIVFESYLQVRDDTVIATGTKLELTMPNVTEQRVTTWADVSENLTVARVNDGVETSIADRELAITVAAESASVMFTADKVLFSGDLQALYFSVASAYLATSIIDCTVSLSAMAGGGTYSKTRVYNGIRKSQYQKALDRTAGSDFWDEALENCGLVHTDHYGTRSLDLAVVGIEGHWGVYDGKIKYAPAEDGMRLLTLEDLKTNHFGLYFNLPSNTGTLSTLSGMQWVAHVESDLSAVEVYGKLSNAFDFTGATILDTFAATISACAVSNEWLLIGNYNSPLLSAVEVVNDQLSLLQAMLPIGTFRRMDNDLRIGQAVYVTVDTGSLDSYRVFDGGFTPVPYSDLLPEPENIPWANGQAYVIGNYVLRTFSDRVDLYRYSDVAIVSDNPVDVIEHLLITYCNLSSLDLVTDAFTLARSARLLHHMTLTVSGETAVNSLIDTISKEHGLFTYEGKDGRVGICALGSIPDTEDVRVITGDDLCLENGKRKQIKRKYLSLDYFISDLAVEYEGGKLASSELICQPYLLSANEYLRGVAQKAKLTLTTVTDAETAQQCACIKMAHHHAPAFEVSVELREDIGIDVGQWVNVELVGVGIITAYNDLKATVYIYPSSLVEAWEERFSDDTVEELQEEFDDSVNDLIQEVF